MQEYNSCPTIFYICSKYSVSGHIDFSKGEVFRQIMQYNPYSSLIYKKGTRKEVHLIDILRLYLFPCIIVLLINSPIFPRSLMDVGRDNTASNITKALYRLLSIPSTYA